MIPILAASAHPNPWMVLPFVALLLCIALFPILVAHHWERHYAKIAVGLGAITGSYYIFGLSEPAPVVHALEEYISFMALIGSLYVISGGININVRGGATPLVNVAFLLTGAVLANIVGTTGASMLLIRPWIRMNKVRITGFHVVFFIFIVSNAGGCLTPIGDPPLFLGFLRGVPFWWVLAHAWPAWLLVVGTLLAIFFILDVRNFRRAPAPVRTMEKEPEQWSFRGLGNLLPLGAVLAAVFLPHEWKIGTHEFGITASALVMLAAAAISYFTTPKPFHEANDFNFHPVAEVGWLFIGIFITMIPALQLLGGGDALHLRTPLGYYFACGTLSAFLDNAPTYLTFLAAKMGTHGLDVMSVTDVRHFVVHHEPFLIAISLSAVFFGAGSYIGNGPNFMVKSICEKAGVPTPSFLAYVWRYALPYLLPVIAIAGWLLARFA